MASAIDVRTADETPAYSDRSANEVLLATQSLDGGAVRELFWLGSEEFEHAATSSALWNRISSDGVSTSLR
jgi:hypothetical protein